MFEVPHSAPRANGRRLALLWMGVAGISIVVTSLLYTQFYRIFDGLISDIRLLRGLIALIPGLFIILLQWLVLRRFFPRLGRWVPVLGGILVLSILLERILYGLTKVLMLIFTSMPSSLGTIDMAWPVIDLFWALISGIAGWWLFRPLTRRAWLWPAALLAGAVGQTLVTMLVLKPLIESGFGSGAAITYRLFNIAVSLAGAALQAAVLVSFLRERERLAVPAPV
jgi:hypothetical protein